jgi:hypothetical protein
MMPIRPSIIGLASFKTNCPESARKLPPAIRKLANYEYHNLKFSHGVIIPNGLITPSAIKGRCNKSCHISAKGFERRFFDTNPNLVINLVSDKVRDNVQNTIIDFTRTDGCMMINLKNDCKKRGEIIDLTIPEYKLVINLTKDSEANKNENKDSLLAEEILSKQCHFTAFDRSNLDN